MGQRDGEEEVRGVGARSEATKRCEYPRPRSEATFNYVIGTSSNSLAFSSLKPF